MISDYQSGYGGSPEYSMFWGGGFRLVDMGLDLKKQNAEASRGSPRFTDALSVSKSGGQTCVILQFRGVSFGKCDSKITHGRFLREVQLPSQRRRLFVVAISDVVQHSDHIYALPLILVPQLENN